MRSEERAGLQRLVGLVEEVVTSSLTKPNVDPQMLQDRLARLAPADRTTLMRTGYATLGAVRVVSEVLARRKGEAGSIAIDLEAPRAYDASDNGNYEMRSALIALGEMFALLRMILDARAGGRDDDAIALINEQVRLLGRGDVERLGNVGQLVRGALGIVLYALEESDEDAHD